MEFNSLKDKCEYYRSTTDYKIEANNYVIVMLDGHCFSRMIKNKFKKPFDEFFMRAMNETAIYLLENIQGAKFAYTQSDEISILITDFDTEQTSSCFGYRLCKMQSIFASMAAAKFNQIMLAHYLKDKAWVIEETKDGSNGINILPDVMTAPLYSFDCKAWSVPSYNDAYCHFLWRQHDCTRNSKQQTAQTWLPHKELLKKTTDEQVQLLLNKHGIDWNTYSDGEKYGRLIYKEDKHMCKIINGKEVEFDRSVWLAHGCKPFDEENSIIKKLIPQRQKNVIQLKSRYGKTHKLIPTEQEHIYVFQSAEEWMTFSLIGEKGKYVALDPDGGPMICVDSEINGRKVAAITENKEGKILVELW